MFLLFASTSDVEQIGLQPYKCSLSSVVSMEQQEDCLTVLSASSNENSSQPVSFILLCPLPSDNCLSMSCPSVQSLSDHIIPGEVQTTSFLLSLAIQCIYLFSCGVCLALCMTKPMSFLDCSFQHIISHCFPHSSLPLPRRLCNARHLFVYLSVCLSVSNST